MDWLLREMESLFAKADPRYAEFLLTPGPLGAVAGFWMLISFLLTLLGLALMKFTDWNGWGFNAGVVSILISSLLWCHLLML